MHNITTVQDAPTTAWVLDAIVYAGIAQFRCCSLRESLRCKPVAAMMYSLTNSIVNFAVLSVLNITDEKAQLEFNRIMVGQVAATIIGITAGILSAKKIDNLFDFETVLELGGRYFLLFVPITVISLIFEQAKADFNSRNNF